MAIGDNKVFPPAKKIIDASGLCVLPGIWHTHCHFREPGHEYKENFETGSRAAAAGGVTFVIDQTNVSPHPSTRETFEIKKETIKSKSVVDYALYGAGLYPREIEELAKAGAIAIKIFNTRHIKEIYPYISELGVVDHGLLYELYEAVAQTGLMVAVHHDDTDWVKRMVFRDFIDQGKIDNKAYMEAYEKGYMYGHGMVAGLAASLYYANLAKVPLYVLHLGVMPEGAYEMIRHAKQELGQKVYAEMEVSALLMNKKQAEKIGPFTYLWAYNPQPGWQAINKGVADTLTIEHAPHSKAEVEPGWQDNFSVPLGITGVQEFVSLMLNQVNKKMLRLEDFVRLSAENPAKIYGLYPKKGVIQIGSDADFTIVDMNKRKVLKAEDMYSKTGLTSWEGVEVIGVAAHTIIRGRHVAEYGKVLAEPGFGKFTSRVR